MDQSRSRTSASKPAFDSAARRWLSGATLLLALSSCDAGYPLAPTPCDDYCLATQRAECDDDQPADCVRDCQLELGRRACEAALQALSACYGASAESAFACEDDQSRVGAVCLAERRTLDECLLPGSGGCFDECVRQSSACEGSLDDCEQGCLHPTPGCEKASGDYYTCLQDYPVECREWLQMETRDEAHTPCYPAALALFGCGE